MSNYAAVILAAGESSRMGEPKQLLSFHGKSFLENVLTSIRDVFDNRFCVVLGANKEKIRAEVDLQPGNVVHNSDWMMGMGTSIAVGVKHIQSVVPVTDAIVFFTVDQPFLTSQHITDLIRAHEQSGKAIVASAYEKTVGIPALFNSDFFTELGNLTSDKGAKEIIQRHAHLVATIDFEAGGTDIDTPSQYRDLVNRQ